MAAGKISIAEEVLQSISLHQMHAIPAYLSESDATTIDEFTQSELSSNYVLDTQNLYWPGKVNRSHVFDLFAEFLPHKDGGKTRLDMINFVSDNRERYVIDGHVVLKMHETNLNAWACKMTYWENSADELTLYALSDLTRQHTVVITRTKPWSTVHPDVVLKDIHGLLDVCGVKLLYLGDNKFGRLRRRPQNFDTSIMVNLPVFPGTETPCVQEMETACSLLLMNVQETEHQELNDERLELQEPAVTQNELPTVEPSPDLVDLTVMLDSPPQEHTDGTFNDAMEHIVGHVLVSSPLTTLNVPDAVDSMCASVLVETTVKQDPKYILVDPKIERQIKHCSIKLTKIDSVLTYGPKQNLCQALMQAGRPHTRSMCTPKPPKRSRHRKASLQTVNYKELDTTSEEELSRKQLTVKTRAKPGAAGPSNDRISSQNNKTVYPTQRLLPIKPDTPITSLSDKDNSDAATEPYEPDVEEEKTEAPKGTFQITVKSLKKTKKYRCKYCDEWFDSSRNLTDHHQKCHKIMYCKECNRAFNNPTTYSRHLKGHSSKGQICAICGKAFAYESQLKAHQSVHSTVRHKCTYKSCTRDFKNIGDLTRHLMQHSSEKHQCLDCEYSNADIRNFESHRLKHSRIAKYSCNVCQQEFIYNTEKKCRVKRSASPDY